MPGRKNIIIDIIDKNNNNTKENQVVLNYPQEKHFKNMRQLTFGGDNAEAYFSSDGKNDQD